MPETGKMRFAHSTISALRLLAAAALVLVTQSPAEASEFTGEIKALRFSAGSQSARVSVFAGPHSSPCNGNPEWFAFENANQGVGALWTSALTSALTQNRTIFITGSGACDSFGVEGVNFIEVR